jgi:hypothetical protein
MNILITNIALNNRSGTTIFVKDLSFFLISRGHSVAVYSPRCGNFAEEIRKLGVEVVERLEDLKLKPDIIHGHHNITLLTALRYLPSTPAIFVCHDFISWFDRPIGHPNIIAYVAVDKLVQSRINTVLNIPNEKIQLVYNSFNEKLFTQTRKLPIKPLSSLIYCKHPDIDRVIIPVCNRLGIEVDIAGSGFNKNVTAPENLLFKYDLIFTSAMSAIEALASGASVIICDGRGAFGMVQQSNYRYLQEYNFGLKTLQSQLSPEFVEANIHKYDRDDAEVVSSFVRQKSQWSDRVILWEKIYLQAISDFQKTSTNRDLFYLKIIPAIFAINTLRIRYILSRELIAIKRKVLMIFNR